MTETKVYADDFKCSFGDSDQFIEFLKERKAQSTWLTAPSKSLQFRALKGNENLSNLYNRHSGCASGGASGEGRLR